ncbi:MAG: SpoIIE family protein phosphatase [bacterium]|nr:SpoIIE family protein phosphatase [bacterium]
MEKESIFKKVYDFYSNDFTSQEFEKLILKETPTRYKYYLKSMSKPRQHKNKFVEIGSFIKNLSLAFLRRLSPLIRIIYSVLVFAFIISYFKADWNLAVFSFVVMNLLLVFEVADKLTARDELDVARDVQTSLIPLHSPEDNNFSISCHYETAKEVGGDFIDFAKKANGSYYIAIGDISGKGMSAALYMVQVRLLLRHIAEFSETPKQTLVSLNKNMFKHIKKGLYLSAVLAEVCGRTLKICRAGHNPLLYYNSVTQTCEEVKQNGMALGLNNGILFENSLEEVIINVNQDDIILFYSDGLTETMNANRVELGVERIKQIILASSHKTSQEIKDDILSDVSKFRGYAEVHDDLTMILLKVK